MRGLLDRGYRVSTFARSISEELRTLSESRGSALFICEADVADSARMAEVVAESETAQGPLFGLVNNSAIAVDGVLATLPEVEIVRMMSVNLEAAVLLARTVIRRMLRNSTGGRIINISSIVGSRGYSGLSVYGATKAGLDGFTRGLAREVGRRGILVNSVAPGYMRTSMSMGLGNEQLDQIRRRTPLGRLAEPQDVLGVIAFLLSEDAAFLTGQTITVDGGITN